MIEAVNSVLSNAPLLRGSAEQQSTARAVAANPERVQEVAQAPYISPYVHMDINYDKAVLQIRDSATGDVVRQIPTEPALEAARRQNASVAARRVQQEEFVSNLAPEPRKEQVTTQTQQVAAPAQASQPVTQQQFAAFANAANAAVASQSTVTVFA